MKNKVKNNKNNGIKNNTDDKKKSGGKKSRVVTVVQRLLVFMGLTLGILIAGLYAVMWICVNGPSWVAGDLFVLSVRETSAAGFLADLYCSDEKIAQIEERNKVEDVDTITDVSIIKIEKDNNDKNNNNGGNTDSEGGGKKEEFVDGICVEQVKGPTFEGIMMIIKDPSRVVVGSLEKYGEGVYGKTVEQFISSYGAVAGSNAGGFEDPGGHGLGGIPEGLVISGGELKWGSKSTTYEVIGFNEDNILVVGYMTGQKALDLKVRDAVSFGPILIVNGVPATSSGTGGGLNPRTAIGQRSDGAVLLLVIDGRRASSMGASMNDVTNVMLEYGAVNAANLDGGSSSVLYHNGKLLNISSSVVGVRTVPTSILVKQQ